MKVEFNNLGSGEEAGCSHFQWFLGHGMGFSKQFVRGNFYGFSFFFLPEQWVAVGGSGG